MASIFNSGLDYGVATTLDQVLAAWHLVYTSYRRLGLIKKNEWELHAVPQVIQSKSFVITGTIRGEVASTLTIMHDGDGGLPIETVYEDEIASLRNAGSCLLEVGLLADRREEISRTIDSLMSLFRFPWFNARYSGCDIVCGVHPHHVNFYKKMFGFETIGPTRSYARVGHHAVVLLQLSIESSLRQKRLPRATKVYVENPLDETAFDSRCDLALPAIAKSPLPAYFSNI